MQEFYSSNIKNLQLGYILAFIFNLHSDKKYVFKKEFFPF